MQPALADVVQYATLPRFDCDDRRALVAEQVVALVLERATRLAEVVLEVDGADDREEDPRDRARGGRRLRRRAAQVPRRVEGEKPHRGRTVAACSADAKRRSPG